MSARLHCIRYSIYAVENVGGKDAGTSMATLSILDIGPVIFGTTDNLVKYLSCNRDSHSKPSTKD